MSKTISEGNRADSFWLAFFQAHFLDLVSTSGSSRRVVYAVWLGFIVGCPVSDDAMKHRIHAAGGCHAVWMIFVIDIRAFSC
jgi:hypothetical protein